MLGGQAVLHHTKPMCSVRMRKRKPKTLEFQDSKDTHACPVSHTASRCSGWDHRRNRGKIWREVEVFTPADQEREAPSLSFLRLEVSPYLLLFVLLSSI